MCLSDREALAVRMDGEEGLRLDRRTAILGTACLALTATLPRSIAASGRGAAARRLRGFPGRARSTSAGGRSRLSGGSRRSGSGIRVASR
jgi:hypothetical protein